MKRLRAILLLLGSMVITSLSIACSSFAQPTPTMVTQPADQGEVPGVAAEVPRVTVEELKKRLDNGDDILVIDTRISTRYDLKHIPGAITRPDSFDEVAHDQEIVAYCA
jgi:3-mercaptopyruvate sulfurtransferase SseA